MDGEACAAQAHRCAAFLQEHAALLGLHPCDTLKPGALRGTVLGNCLPGTEPPAAAEHWGWDDIADLARGTIAPHWPLPLRNLVAKANCLALPRQPLPNLPRKSLSKQCQVGFTPKKLHEVECLAACVADLAALCSTTRVVDLGCGEGYLSQALSFVHSLDVVGVDCQGDRQAGAERRAAKLTSFLESRLRLVASGRPQSGSDPNATPPVGTANILPGIGGVVATAGTVPGRQQMCTRTLPASLPATLLSEDDIAAGAVCVGLHTCGDLGPTTLRLFAA
eukprot:EG_transcript_22184